MLTESDNDPRLGPRAQGDDGPVGLAHLGHVKVRVLLQQGHVTVVQQVVDLVVLLVRVEPGPDGRVGGRVDAQGLEENAEEPGQEDVAWHQPGQLFPVLLAITDRHGGHELYTPVMSSLIQVGKKS